MMTMYISPYRRLAGLREAMDRALEESLSEKDIPEREMMLAVDVAVEPEEFVVTAFVPGLEAEDLNLEILKNSVTIRGEFKPTVAGEVKYLTSELPVGKFLRVISFPTDIEANKADAAIKNGVLTLHVPKAETVRPKTIKINVN